MNKVALCAYRIQVRRQHKRKNPYVSVADFDGNDLLAHLKQWLANCRAVPVTDPATGRHLTLEDPSPLSSGTAPFSEIEGGRGVEGFFVFGYWGDRNPIVDINTSKLVHDKLTSQAELVPLYFRFVVPAEGEEAFLILQKYRGISVFDLVRRQIKEYFVKHLPEFGPIVEQFVTDAILLHVVNSYPVGKVSMKSPGVLHNAAKALGLSKTDERAGWTETRVDFKGLVSSSLKRQLQAQMKRRLEEKEMFVPGGFLHLSDREYSELTVEFYTPAGPRIMSFANPFSFNFDMEITRSVWTKSAKDVGRPEVNKIQDFARTILLDRVSRA